MTEPNLEIARRYLQAIEQGATGDALAVFLAEDVVQEELPNRLVPNGARRDRAAILEGAARGQNVVRDQRYEVLSAVAERDRVALEVAWSATLKVPIATMPEGHVMRARFAVFLRFRDGLVVEQRNYDCFEPW